MPRKAPKYYGEIKPKQVRAATVGFTVEEVKAGITGHPYPAKQLIEIHADIRRLHGDLTALDQWLDGELAAGRRVLRHQSASVKELLGKVEEMINLPQMK